MSEEKVNVTRGSGNVYADLGLPDAEEHARKAELVQQIEAILRRRKLTQVQAAKVLGISQPDVSRLMRGNFREYSLERLLRLLMALGRDIEIVIRRNRSQRPSRLDIRAA